MSSLLSQRPATPAARAASSPAPWVLYLAGGADGAGDAAPAEGAPGTPGADATPPLGPVLFGPGPASGQPLSADAARDPAALAAAVQQQVGPGGELYVALNTTLCYPAAVSMDDLPARGRRAMLAFRIEEHLPLPLEDLVIDYAGPLDDPDSATALGVATETRVLAGLCQALEEAGLRTLAVAPATLLTAQAIAEAAHASGQPTPDAVLLPGPAGAGLEVVTFGGHKSADGWPAPGGWFRFGPRADAGLSPAQETQLGVFAGRRGGPMDLVLAADDGPLAAALRACPAVRAVRAVAPPPAAGHLVPDAAPWIDLRRDALDPGLSRRHQDRLQRWSLWACVVLALLVVGLWVRGGRYAQAADTAVAAQDALFRDVAGPGVRRPVSLIRGLRSIAASRQAGGGAGGVPATAHQRLFATLAALPDDPPAEVLRLRVEADRVELTLAADTNAAAERLALQLSKADGARPLGFGVQRSAASADGRVVVEMIGEPGGPRGNPR